MGDVSARKRPSGASWEYRITLASINGKRQQKSKSGFKTKAEALKAGREALEQYENCGEFVVPSEMSVSDLCDKWLEEYGKTDLQAQTIDGYEKKIRLYIKPVIGKYMAKSVTRLQLQELITDMANKGFSKNTLASVKGLINSIFDWGEMNKIIKSSPAYKLKIPKRTEVKSRIDSHVFIPKEMIEKIFDRFPKGSSAYIPLMIAYHCGLRLGETFGLVWEDIDFEDKTLTVNRQVQWMSNKNRTKEDKLKQNGTKETGGGYWYFSTPKYDSYRTIDLDDELLADLIEEKEKQIKAKEYYGKRYYNYYSTYNLLEKNHDIDMEINPIGLDETEFKVDFVNRRESGEYVSPRTMQHVSSVIHKQLDFKEFDFHSLRHTHATMLLEQKAPFLYIKDRLGHVKIDTTKVYTDHLTDTMSKEGLNVLMNIYKK